jgi:pimeloyl-ACP methyl ester carboxylesterase
MITRNQIEINGKRISYLKSGEGQNLILFLHGSGMAAENWRPQLQDERLKNHYSLIAIDLPGHGESEWSSKDPFLYHPQSMARLIMPLIDHLNPQSFLLVGLSLGTNIIAEIASPLTGCVGIVLASPCVINDANQPGEIFTPGPYGHVITSLYPSETDLRAYVFYHLKVATVAERYISSFKNTDPAFREQLGIMMSESSWGDELANIASWNVPVCIIFGENDSFLKTHYLDSFAPIWNDNVNFIPTAGHQVNEEQPEQFNQILLDYANERFK